MLTNRQLALLTFIDTSIRENWFCPSFAEMGVGISGSKSVVFRALRQLERHGTIRRLRNRDRAIEVLGMPMRVFIPEDGKMVHAGQVVVTHVG